MTDELLQKYIEGTASDDERKEVTFWLMENPDNLKRYEDERKIFESLLWEEEDLLPSKTKHLSIRHYLHEVIKIAAVIAITLSVVTWLTNYEKEPLEAYQTMVVPIGQHAELNLSDGTKVWLNSGSTLTFPASFSDDERQVKLDGEGYFKVTRNVKCPFVVETTKGNIRVLGTEFNVIAYQNQDMWETSLLKGVVEVFNPEVEGETVRLEPNTKVSIQGNHFIKENIGETSRFLWRNGLLCFNNTSVNEILKKVELYYGVTIRVNNKKLLEEKYTGKFRIQDGVEHVLKVLQLNHKFIYEENNENNEIIIY